MSFVLRLSQGAGAHPLGAVTRLEVESQIEELIAVLDRLDGDPDAEPDRADEPYLDWTTTMAHGDRNDLEQCEVPA